MTPTPAGLLRRLGAMIYDGLVVIALWMATLFPIVALTNTAAVGAAVQSLLFFELVAFFVFFWYTPLAQPSASSHDRYQDFRC